MRATCNPGGKGHEWLKRKFVEFARHVNDNTDARTDIKGAREEGKAMSEPRLYVNPPSTTEIDLARQQNRAPRQTYFLPSFSNDNPGLDTAEYDAALSRLDVVTRKQLSNGDWDAIFSGEYFKAEWFKYLDQSPGGLTYVRSWDLAATDAEPGKDPDWTVGVKMALQPVSYPTGPGSPPKPLFEKKVIISSVVRFRKGPGETEADMHATGDRDGRSVPIVIEQEGGSAGKTVVHGAKTRVFVGHIVHGVRKTGAKATYWKALSSIAEAGNVYLVRGEWNEEFIRELCSLPVGHDDQADAAAQAFMHLTTKTTGEKINPNPTTPNVQSKFEELGS